MILVHLTEVVYIVTDTGREDGEGVRDGRCHEGGCQGG